MDISVIVPVYNEQENLNPLFERLTKTLDGLGKSYEIIFVNDGSADKSFEMLSGFHKKRPDVVKVIDFTHNFGQHPAIIAGFANASGNLVVTIDADLQNPPEEIVKIVREFEAGHDSIGTIRLNRNNNWFRRYGSKAANKLRRIVTKVPITDQGCMLRGYSKEIASRIARESRKSTFIPMLAYKFSKNPVEIYVLHAARNAGESKYNAFSLAKLALNLFKNGKPTEAELEKPKYEIREKIGF